MHTIWPVVYAIFNGGHKIVDMRYNQVKDAEMGVVIDQGDYTYVYIKDSKLRAQIMKIKYV